MNRKLDGLKVVADAVAASATNVITSVTSTAQGSAPALTAQVSDLQDWCRFPCANSCLVWWSPIRCFPFLTWMCGGVMFNRG